MSKSQHPANNASSGLEPRLSVGRTFSALRHHNYRLWFIGQLVSLFGTWMQATAQGFLVFELTNSPAYLGYVGFANGLPSWLFMLYAGVVADRMPRRTLLVLTQCAMMVLAIILAALTFTRLIQAWHIIVLALLLGIANAFDAPARQAFVLEMVDREDLTNAIALNSSMFNAATAVGPAVAGITYAALGPAWCFSINAVTFVAVIAALMLMRLKPMNMPSVRASALSAFKEGVGFVLKHEIIRLLMMVVVATSLFGMGFATLTPAWSVKVLGGDATTNGLLQSARGLGSMLGALMIASLGNYRYRGRMLTLGSFVFPILLLLFVFARWVPLSLALLLGVGWGFMILINSANSLVQTQVPDNLRGRVMSIFTFTFFGFLPIGALVAGNLAERFGEPLAVVFGSVVCLLFAAVVWLTAPKVRALE